MIDNVSRLISTVQTKTLKQFNFIKYLSKTLRGLELDIDDNIIIGGDFNCPLDPTLDKKVAS